VAKVDAKINAVLQAGRAEIRGGLPRGPFTGVSVH
jgi:hypothetical protein